MRFRGPPLAEPLPFSVEDFRRRISSRMGPVVEGVTSGDHMLNPEIADIYHAGERRPAAVLVPIVAREPEATILFTLRTAGLRTHGGQIAFPGGRVDPEDASAEAAALREAEEEIGLSASHIETLCRGPDYLVGSGYMIAPIIAAVRPGFTLRLNPAEVDDVFEVPLSFLMDPVNHRMGSRVWQGFTRRVYEMPYEERFIWGATAGILRILYERLYHDDPVTG